MNMRHSLSIIAVVVLVLCGILLAGYGYFSFQAQSAGPQGSADPMMKTALDQVSDAIESELSLAASLVRTYAAEFTVPRDNISETHAILTDLYRLHSIASSVMLVESGGVIRDIAPALDTNLIGSPDGLNLTSADFSVETGNMSDYRTFTDGRNGVTYSYPIYGENQTFVGYLSMNIDTTALVGPLSKDLYRSTGYDIWIAQSDGTVLYDADTFEIGRNMLTDPLYQSPLIHEPFRIILSEPSGSLTYSFYDNGWSSEALVDVVWKSLNITGTQRWIVNVANRTLKESNRHVAITPETVALEQLIFQAFAYIHANGKEASIAEFNNISGMFTNGESYIYAYDMNGTILALPYQKEMLGINRSSQTDINGVRYMQQALVRVGQGGGYMYFVYPNPAKNYTPEMKLAYLLPVDDTWFIGTGAYLPNVPTTVDQDQYDAMITQVRSMQSYAHQYGKEATLAAINQQDGIFSAEGIGMFAGASDGTVLANPFHPETVGTNTLGITNEYGMSLARDVLNLANRGGGMMYSSGNMEHLDSSDIYMIYVEPVDSEWFVGSAALLT